MKIKAIKTLAISILATSTLAHAIPSQVRTVSSPNYQATPSGSYQERSTFENWPSGKISTAGYFHHGFDIHTPSTHHLFPGPVTSLTDLSSLPEIEGVSMSDVSSVLSGLNPNNRWTFNTAPDSGCFYTIGGPNTCYSANNYKLNFHGENTSQGDGHLIVSRNKVAFNGGIIIETTLRPWCTSGSGGCWANFGLYDGEMNYRAIGFRKDGNSPTGYLNIWGTVKEIPFNSGLYGNRTWSEGATYSLKIQYWKNSSGVWRWDYFLNNSWVAGHNATDRNDVKNSTTGVTTTSYMFGNIGQSDAFAAGSAYFHDKKAYIELGFGGYQEGGAIAEGSFGPITVTRW